MPNMYGSNRVTRLPRGGGATNTHGEHCNRRMIQPLTKGEKTEIELTALRKKIRRTRANLSATRNALRWLLATYDFEPETVERINQALDD